MQHIWQIYSCFSAPLPLQWLEKNAQAHRQFMNEFLVLPHTRILLKRNSRQRTQRKQQQIKRRRHRYCSKGTLRISKIQYLQAIEATTTIDRDVDVDRGRFRCFRSMYWYRVQKRWLDAERPAWKREDSGQGKGEEEDKIKLLLWWLRDQVNLWMGYETKRDAKHWLRGLTSMNELKLRATATET